MPGGARAWPQPDSYRGQEISGLQQDRMPIDSRCACADNSRYTCPSPVAEPGFSTRLAGLWAPLHISSLAAPCRAS